MNRVPRVLSIAGTDPTGGAGIQADLKSIAANGGYGMSVVTALVAQNTLGVRSIHRPPVTFLREQLNAVSDDVAIDAVKIGMLADDEVAAEVRFWLDEARPPIVVLDPVMVATSGDRLLDEQAELALRALLPSVDIVTPNAPELAILAEAEPARDWTDLLAQAREVAARYQVLVLAKGGHLVGELVHDALVHPNGSNEQFTAARIETTSTHGTGCSLSSALATRRAKGETWAEATEATKHWLTESIKHGVGLEVGTGNGPINHFAGLWARGGTTIAPPPDKIAKRWWSDIADVRAAIDDLDFIRALGEGDLDPAAFAWYLGQDTLYLREYSRVLALASRLAPSTREQAFWAAGAHTAITAEMSMHGRWVKPTEVDRLTAAPATISYLDHLRSAGADGNYSVLTAALLPCYWLYYDVGTRLHPQAHAQHAYAEWLDTYAAPGFAEATAEAINIVTEAAYRSDERTRSDMRRAFRASAEHELEFWAAPLTMYETPTGLP